MSRYRKVDPRIWNDAKFRTLNDQGKLLFFFLLTHPHMTAIGAMRASLPGLASEIGWTEKALREAFQEVSSKGMAMHDESASFVWLPKFIKYNQPESPNVVKAWVHALEMLPECSLLSRAVAESVAFAKGMNKGFAEALPEAFSKAMPIQELEQELEQEQELKQNPAPDKPAFVLPDWINTNDWALWLKTRKGKKMIPDQMQAQVDKLSAWRDAGLDHAMALKNAATAGWQGLFEPKPDRSTPSSLTAVGQRAAKAGSKWLESQGMPMEKTA